MEKLSVISFKIFVLLLCSLFFLGSFWGCEKSFPDYRQTAFDAEIVFITPNARLCATAEVSAPSQNHALRDVTLTFSEPQALKGLILTRRGGTVSLNFQDLCIEDVPVQALLRGIDLLLSEGAITILGKENRESIGSISAELEDEQEGKSYALSLEPTTGFPKELRTDTELLQIKSFRPSLP